MTVSKEKKKEYNKKYQQKMKEKLEKLDSLSEKEDSSSVASKKEDVSVATDSSTGSFFFSKNLKEKIMENAILTSIPLLMSIIYKTGYIISQKMYQQKSHQEQSQVSHQEQANNYLNVVNF